MGLEVSDLLGAGKSIEKLVDVVSAAVGAIYRPRQMRNEADAKAYEIKAIERAKVEAEISARDAQFANVRERITTLATDFPELAERARLRLLTREIEGQINVELIADQAALALPSSVSDEPVSPDWRRKFFQQAENVCDVDMQALWGKVLAGEITSPGAFGLRTLDVLTQLTKGEAELFRLACRMAMADGYIVVPGFDLNESLKAYGIGYDEILRLRDAGLLLHGDNIHQDIGSLVRGTPDPSAGKVMLTNNGVFIQLSGPGLPGLNQLSLAFTQAGKELQTLIAHDPNERYLSDLGRSLRARSVEAKRGTSVVQDAVTSVIVFESDL